MSLNKLLDKLYVPVLAAFGAGTLVAGYLAGANLIGSKNAEAAIFQAELTKQPINQPYKVELQEFADRSGSRGLYFAIVSGGAAVVTLYLVLTEVKRK